MWLPCPTSAPAWNSSTWSTSSSPWRTSRVSQRSGKPNEKPTFLKPQAKPRPRRSASGRGGEGGEGRGRLGRREGLGPVGGVGAAVDDDREADAGRHLGARRAEGPVAQQVAPAQLDRVHAQALGQLVHLGLGHERALRSAEAAEGAAGHGVGEHGEAVDGQVGDLVRARHAQVEVPEHLVGRVVVGAGVEVARGLRHHDPTVRRGPPPGVDPAAVALVVADHRLLAAPLAADGTALAAVGQPPRREGHDDLQRHVLPPAERAADGRVDDPHPLGREVEGVGDLLLVLVGPLAGDGHRDPTLVVDPADRGLGLQVGVLLVRQVVRPLDDDVGLRPSPRRCRPCAAGRSRRCWSRGGGRAGPSRRRSGRRRCRGRRAGPPTPRRGARHRGPPHPPTRPRRWRSGRPPTGSRRPPPPTARCRAARRGPAGRTWSGRTR